MKFRKCIRLSQQCTQTASPVAGQVTVRPRVTPGIPISLGCKFFAAKQSVLAECSPPVKIAKRPFENYTYRLTKYAYFQNHTAVYSIEPVELIDGALPLRQQRFVEAWAELHTGELDEAWQQLQSGQLPITIAPLR